MQYWIQRRWEINSSLIHRFLSLANIIQMIKASMCTRNSLLSIEHIYLFSNFVITCTRPRYFVSFARNQAKPYKFDRFSNLWINTRISRRKKVCSSIVCDYCLLKFMLRSLILSVDTERWLCSIDVIAMKEIWMDFSNQSM